MFQDYSKPLSIYTDLDTVMDTRATIAYALDKENFKKQLTSYQYVYRKKDVFGNIPYDVFRNYYKQRDSVHLMDAYPTFIPYLMLESMADALRNVARVDIEYDNKIYLNIHPYELELEERENVKHSILSFIPNAKIEIVNKNYDLLTPKWVRENIGTMYMYDAPYWLEYHMNLGTLLQYPLLETMVIGPSLAVGDTKNVKLDDGFFKNFEAVMSKIADYHCLSARYFSGIAYWDEEKIKEEEQKEDKK